MESSKITSKELIEALEQIRMGFTASRIALSACTLLYPLKRLGEKWGKKFTRIQQEYHKFLLDTYNGIEEEYQKLLKEEQNEKSLENTDYDIPESVVSEFIENNPGK